MPRLSTKSALLSAPIAERKQGNLTEAHTALGRLFFEVNPLLRRTVIAGVLENGEFSEWAREGAEVPKKVREIYLRAWRALRGDSYAQSVGYGKDGPARVVINPLLGFMILDTNRDGRRDHLQINLVCGSWAWRHFDEATETQQLLSFDTREVLVSFPLETDNA